MEKDILLNNDGLKVKCVVDRDHNVYFEFDKNLEFLRITVILFRDTAEYLTDLTVLYLPHR